MCYFSGKSYGFSVKHRWLFISVSDEMLLKSRYLFLRPHTSARTNGGHEKRGDSRTALEDMLRPPECACAAVVSRCGYPGEVGAAVLFISNVINFKSERCPDMPATLSPIQRTLIPSRWVSLVVLKRPMRGFSDLSAMALPEIMQREPVWLVSGFGLKYFLGWDRHR